MRIILLVVASWFLGAIASAQDSEPAGSEDANDRWTIVHAGTLVARADATPLREQSIVVKNDRIHSVAAGYVSSIHDMGNAAAEIIDLKADYVLPGLIDAHVHLGLGSDHADRREEETGAEAYRMLSVTENAKKTLNAGYTTVRNPGSAGWAVFAYRDGVKKGVFAGPRVLTAGHTIKIGTFKSDGPGACYDIGSCKEAVRRQIDMGADWIKLYATCSGSKPCGRELAPAVFLEDEIQAVIETARTRQIPVAAHAHGTAGINAALRAGVRSIEHGSYNNEESRRHWKRTGAFYVPTLAVQDNIIKDYETASEAMKPVMEGFMEQHPERVAAAYRAGVKIAAGSDAGVTPHGANARELYWYVKIGMSPSEALQAATLVNAEMLQMEDDIGSIEPGKYADIISVVADPLKDIEALGGVRFVMASGKVVKYADRDR